MLLILDIDETLVHATEAPLDIPHDFSFSRYFVYKRPHLDEFIDFCMDRFDVALWTSSTAGYAAIMADELFKNKHLQFVWSRKRCTQRINNEDKCYIWLKKLSKVKKLGFRLEKILVVDDSPEKHEKNYGNLIQVRPFTGNLADTELLVLMQYLDDLKYAENVRHIEKRLWQNTYLCPTRTHP